MYVFIVPQIHISRYSMLQKELYLLTVEESTGKGLKKSTFEINDIAAEILLKFNGTMTYNEIINFFSEKYKENMNEVNEKVNSLIEAMKLKYGFSLREQKEKYEHKIKYIEYENFYPTVVSLEVTNLCNLQCQHCYGEYGIEKRIEFPKGKLEKVFNDLVKIGVMTVEITGGDPSVYAHIVEMIELAFKAGIKSVVLLTNGVKISEELLKTLIKYKRQIYVQVDLHSLDEEYYNWFTKSKGNLSIVKENIKKLVKNQIPIRVVSIITPKNYKELEDIADWCYQKDVNFFATSVVTELGRAKEDNGLIFKDPDTLNEYLQKYSMLNEKYPGFISKVDDVREDISCGALFSQVSINPKGDIKLCTMDTGEYFKFDFGNVFDDTIKEIYDRNREFLNEFINMDYPDAITTCKECENALFCHRCYLRGMIQAKRMKDRCRWFKKYKNSIINLKFNII